MFVLLAAVCLGLYGRFVGLGKWALGVDEYYISRSIDNVLRTGLPRFLCGGYYIRGLTYQYAVAALRLIAPAPELSARLISALSSLIGLPAIYLIGRRLQGRVLGLLMVIVLLASVWEIETSRFARMYAPFQSLFLWYVVYFLDYAVDRRRAALLPMMLLSVLGVLTWEGGALLGVANLLPPLLNHERGRLRRRDWVYLGAMLVLLVALLAATTDLRGSPPPPLGPPPLETAPVPSISIYLQHRGWIVLWCLFPVPLALHALSWIWSLRRRWLAAVGLCVSLTSAVAHQFILCGAIISLLLVTDLMQLPELTQSAARSYRLALTASAGFWLAFGILTGAWTDTTLRIGGNLSGRWLGILEHLCGFPNVFGEILRPWGRVMPLLTVGMLLLSGALAVRSVRQPANQSAVPRVLLAISLVLVLAIGAREPGRIETRYAFFLYPLFLVMSLAGLLYLVESALANRRAALALGAALSLMFFGLSEDFQPRHVARIDSWNINFRIGMSPVLAAHYYPRADYRLVAAWLTRNVRPADTVMLAIPTIDQYYRRANFSYLPDGDDRYDDYACSTGGIERWTNLPLLYGSNTLAAPIAAGKRIVLLMYPDDARAMLSTARSHDWRASLVWTSPDRGVSVVDINP